MPRSWVLLTDAFDLLLRRDVFHHGLVSPVDESVLSFTSLKVMPFLIVEANPASCCDGVIDLRRPTASASSCSSLSSV